MVARRYTEALDLPGHLGAGDLSRVTAFICEVADATEVDATIYTDRGSIEGGFIAEVLGHLQQTDEVKSIRTTMARVDGGPDSVSMTWVPATPDDSRICIEGVDPRWVLGVAAILRSDLNKLVPKPDNPRSWWRSSGSWWRANKAAFCLEVTSGLVLAALLALWAFVIR